MILSEKDKKARKKFNKTFKNGTLEKISRTETTLNADIRVKNKITRVTVVGNKGRLFVVTNQSWKIPSFKSDRTNKPNTIRSLMESANIHNPKGLLHRNYHRKEKTKPT